ncbi:MAG: hypothetical protein ACK5QT_11690 [Oligoflexia bacterium]
MLSKGGNPRLDTLIKLLKTLKLHFWVVERGFIRSRKRVVRPKDIPGSAAEEAARWITESSHGTHPWWDEGPG